MKFLRKVKQVAIVLWLTVLCCAPAWAAYTKDDIAKNSDNAEALKKIFEDKTSPVDVRMVALNALGKGGIVDYLDTPYMAEDSPFAVTILLAAAGINSDKWNDVRHYPLAIKLIIGNGQSSELYWAQKIHVLSLLKQGKGQEALGEAKRLFALAPLEGHWLQDAVQVVGTSIRGDVLARGKGIKEALAAQNLYLEGIQKEDISKTAFSAAAFPAINPLVASMEKGASALTRIDLLLFNGKFEEAKQVADGLMAAAVNDAELQVAITAAGRVANASTGLPTAANKMFGEKAKEN